MEPLYYSGNTVLASKIPYVFSRPKVGDIIIVQHKGTFFIKRIEKANHGRCFVIGVNKNDSLDSRKIGYIKNAQIKGKIICTLKP